MVGAMLGKEENTEYIFTCSPRTSYSAVGMAGLTTKICSVQGQNARGGWDGISLCWESGLGKLGGKALPLYL